MGLALCRFARFAVVVGIRFLHRVLRARQHEGPPIRPHSDSRCPAEAFGGIMTLLHSTTAQTPCIVMVWC